MNNWWLFILGLPCGAILFCVPAIIGALRKRSKVKKAAAKASQERSVSDRGESEGERSARLLRERDEYWLLEYGIIPGQRDSMQARAAIIDHRIGLWHQKHAQAANQSEKSRFGTDSGYEDGLRAAARLADQFGARIGEKSQDPGPKQGDIPHHPV